MLVTIFISDEELRNHTLLYQELTRSLRMFNAEFYPQLSTTSPGIFLEASLRTLMLIKMTTTHVLHFHHTNFFMSNPLAHLYHNGQNPDVPSIVCLFGYPAFSNEKCSPRLLLIGNEEKCVYNLWKAVASEAIKYPSHRTSGVITESHTQYIDSDTHLLNQILPELNMTTSIGVMKEESITIELPVVYLDHQKIFDVHFYVNESTSLCAISFTSVNFDVPQAIASKLIETVQNIDNSCMVLAEHLELLPW